MRPLTSRTQHATWAILTCALLAGIAAPASLLAADIYTLRLAGHDFEIPQRYFQDDVPGWLRWLPGLDDGSRDALLTIDASEVAAAVPGFKPKDGGYIEDLRVRVVVLRDYEIPRYLDSKRRFSDIWNSTGSYSNRVIERDSETGLVRVYRAIEYPWSWEVFTVSPETETLSSDIFSFWLGHCLNGPSPISSTGYLAICHSHMVVGDIAMHFTVTGQNIDKIHRLRIYLADLLSQWLKKQ